MPSARRPKTGPVKSQKSYRAVKGMQDILPPETYLWLKVESAAAEVFGASGFREMRTPVLENTAVFTRSIGETSDIVEKEMYTFEDKGGRSVTMRPECTASIVRSYVENHLYNEPAPQKYYYSGPMFRYERPQKGRLRQFYQIGVEAFASDGPGMDAEVISMLHRFLDRVGIKGLSVQINSIGCPQCRPAYRDALVGFFSTKLPGLCSDCVRRHKQNPLRILDCKVPGCVELRTDAPFVTDYLCDGCRNHYEGVKGMLSLLHVPFVENPRMVRGLDYYTRTTFEVTSEGLGAQNAVAAGGRYDALVEQFGGPPTPAIGFALGMERLVTLLGDGSEAAPAPDVFIVSLGEEASREALRMAEGLRARGRWAELVHGGGSMKSQMRRADRLGASFVLIIGEDEIRKGALTWKNMKDGSSGEVAWDDVYAFLSGTGQKR